MKSPAFQFYPQDFLVGTADMTCEEVGAYIRLLCYQWSKGGLPKDDKKLMQLSGITDPYVLGNVSVKFRLCDDGLLRNDRLLKIKEEKDDFHKRQRENGQKGGNPAFEKGKHNPYYNPKDNPPLSSGDNPKINSSSSSSSSISNNKEEEAVGSATHKEFISKWSQKYQEVLGVGYKFEGAKDGTAVKTLLKVSGFTLEEFIALAAKAWITDKFWCKHSRTISGFSSKFNNIFGEIGKTAKDIRPSLSDWNNKEFK